MAGDGPLTIPIPITVGGGENGDTHGTNGGAVITIKAEPLRQDAFAPYGYVVQNPRPAVHPAAAFQQQLHASLPFDAQPANQGSAIKYQHVTRMVDLYAQAPSGKPGAAVTNMFVCAARQPLARSGSDPKTKTEIEAGEEDDDDIFPISVLERHPFTTQTFIPLTTSAPRAAESDRRYRYLVVVAPSLPPSAADADLPVPSSSSEEDGDGHERLPGRGLPDLGRLRAFLATSGQAVTYGAGTWHAPMVALGQPDEAVDFVVVQFANGVPVEDCQEVLLRAPSSASESSAGVVVRVSRGGESHGHGHGLVETAK